MWLSTGGHTCRVPVGQGPAAGNGEARLQQTFDGNSAGTSQSSRWEIYNDYVRCYLTFPPEHVGKTVQLYVLLHSVSSHLLGVLRSLQLSFG